MQSKSFSSSSLLFSNHEKLLLIQCELLSQFSVLEPLTNLYIIADRDDIRGRGRGRGFGDRPRDRDGDDGLSLGRADEDGNDESRDDDRRRDRSSVFDLCSIEYSICSMCVFYRPS